MLEIFATTRQKFIHSPPSLISGMNGEQTRLRGIKPLLPEARSGKIVDAGTASRQSGFYSCLEDLLLCLSRSGV